ncbi:MAG TPA: biotin transporter BioY [Ktedonobacteraceae bacterium]|nr:biotin transporter BioY [Ktedonobacteraceae bacterium]
MALSRSTTLVDYLVPSPSSRSLNILKDAALVVGFSLLVALSAQIAFPIPWSPVPVTLQTLAVLLTGAVLGSRRGALALLAYLAEGALIPHFFSGGTLVGFDAGYLWAFPIAAFVTGLLCERHLERRLLTSALAMIPGTLIIYAIGVSWLSYFFHWDLLKGFTAGMLPFIPGDIVKLLIATALLPMAWALVKSFHPAMKRS